jgi:hypothetical protein
MPQSVIILVAAHLSDSSSMQVACISYTTIHMAINSGAVQRDKLKRYTNQATKKVRTACQVDQIMINKGSSGPIRYPGDSQFGIFELHIYFIDAVLLELSFLPVIDALMENMMGLIADTSFRTSNMVQFGSADSAVSGIFCQCS